MVLKRIDIIIFVEHRDREYGIACSIAKRLTEHHRKTVAVASLIYHPLIACIIFRPSVVVMPSLGFGRGSVGWLFNKIYPGEIEYVNMNYEQFIGNWQGTLKKPKHPISFKRQIQLAWGNHFKDYLVANGVNEENIYITGRPQNYEIIKNYQGKKQLFRKLLTSKYGIDPNIPIYFVAFTENFAVFTEDQIKRYVAGGAREDLIHKHKENVSKTISIFIEWINKLSISEHNINIIIKPHPGVSVDLYKDIDISKHDNIILAESNNAYEWLAACDYFITNFSTLSIEARALAIPSYRVIPAGDLNEENVWWCQDCKYLEDYESFEEIFYKSSNDFDFSIT